MKVNSIINASKNQNVGYLTEFIQYFFMKFRLQIALLYHYQLKARVLIYCLQSYCTQLNGVCTQETSEKTLKIFEKKCIAAVFSY